VKLGEKIIMENTINIEVIRALLPLAAKKDTRSYLNGVFVDFQPTKTIYAATNGAVLGLYTEAVENEYVFSVTIPGDVVKQLKPKPGTAKWGDLIFDPEAKTARITNPGAGQDFGFTPLDGKFPDVSKVIPSSTTGEVAQFDAELLYLFAQVNKSFGAKSPGRFKLDHSGNAGALVHLFRDEFIGVIMPVRINALP
jgi:DNA polymerase III sliding clamp (beta) subunit (PCNA family)